MTFEDERESLKPLIKLIRQASPDERAELRVALADMGLKTEPAKPEPKPAKLQWLLGVSTAPAIGIVDLQAEQPEFLIDGRQFEADANDDEAEFDKPKASNYTICQEGLLQLHKLWLVNQDLGEEAEKIRDSL